MSPMRPMLATKGDHVPVGDDWSHEVKWDGMRVLVEVSDRLRLWSRNENDVTVSFPELHPLAGATGHCLLDGEIVAFADGLPSFAAMQDRMHVGRADRAARLAQVNPVTLLLFDVLRLEGREVMREPLTRRRERLVALDLLDDRWQTPPSYDDGLMLFEATRQQGLEGIVSKWGPSIYEPGVRSKRWLKFPHRRRSSWVVGGWRHETDSTSRLGAILVGEPTPDGLLYRGRVGSGIAGKVGPMLKELLIPFARADSPFVDEVPRVDALGTHWVEPIVVVDVEALGLSGQQRLRQPAYRGVRPDLTPDTLLEDRGE